MILASLAAVAASLMFNLGLALQALEARRAPRKLGLRLGLVGILLLRPRWLLGQVLGTAGIGPQVYALSVAPFALVQPLLAVGLLALLGLATATLGEHVGAASVAGVIAIIGGIALVAWGVPPRHDAHRGVVWVVGVVAALGLAAVAPFVLQRVGRESASVVIVASGCGFAVTNIVTKLLSDDLSRGHVWQAGIWAVVGLGFGVIATITGMTAFQVRPATIVVPVTTSVQTFLPILLEPLFLVEHWTSAKADGIPLGCGTLLALVGTVLIGRRGGVARLAAGDAGPPRTRRRRTRAGRRRQRRR